MRVLPEKQRVEMKARDLEGLLFIGKIKDSEIEYCSEDRLYARVVATLETGEKVSTFCIPIRAAGKVNTVIKHYLRMGISKYLVQEEQGQEKIKNVDIEGGEDGVQEDENT